MGSRGGRKGKQATAKTTVNSNGGSKWVLAGLVNEWEHSTLDEKEKGG